MIKAEEKCSQPRYKAQLVVKGFIQKKRVDFDEIFSPVVKMTLIRIVLGLTASMNLEVEQLDVKTTFLHGDLEEEVYMDQPEGFKVKGKEHMVCRQGAHGVQTQKESVWSQAGALTVVQKV